MSVPFFGIIYGCAGGICLLCGLRKNARVLQSLGAILVLVGLFNAYVEEWTILKGFDFKAVTLLLLVGFLWTYTTLILRLTQQFGISKRRVAFGYSFLPIVYALAIGLAAALPGTKAQENPPLAAYIFIVLILVIHVPAFAFGKGQALKIQGQLVNPPKSDSTDSQPTLRKPLLALAAPLLVTFANQVLTREDWRLFGSDCIFAIAVGCLFAIARNNTSIHSKPDFQR